MAAAAVVVAPALVPVPAVADEPDSGRKGDERPAVLTRIRDPRIVEASGMAASRRHPGVLFVVNDSGDGPHLYAVGRDGATRARLTLAGADAYDWEALAAGPGRSLWVGDIGDNSANRASVTVYRVDEPAVLRDGDIPWRAYRLRFADGAHDAEALLVHPRSGRLYVATKSLRNPGLYAAPRHLERGKTAVLRRVGAAPLLVTGGEFSPDGDHIVLRDLASAHLYGQGNGRASASRTNALLRDDSGLVRLPRQPQGESVAWTPDGSALLAGSEGRRSAVWRVPLQGQDVPTGRRAGPAVAERADQPGQREAPGERRPGLRRGLKLLAALAVAGVLAGAALVRRRRGRRG